LKEKPHGGAKFDEEQWGDENPDSPAVGEVEITELCDFDAGELGINDELNRPDEPDERPSRAKMNAKQEGHAQDS
jgi:hypothetical protein